ncbi:MAG: protein kinase [Planctomycetes bacterium]|nr:protein kinase [Planctomycetota bacterium]
MPGSQPGESPRSGGDHTTHALDPLLFEGLRLLTEGGPAAWRAFLDAHPADAARLQQGLHHLETVGLHPLHVAPSRFGPYRVVNRLGGGGMGVVWHVEHEHDGREFAVKAVRPELLLADGSRERFLREMQTVRSLNHPGIVTIEAVGGDGPTPWFAMELVPGQSLQALVSERHADRRSLANAATTAEWTHEVLTIVTQIAEALAHAHARGVVRRDVKASNILVTPAGRAVLIDFGLAHHADATTITRSGTELGSLPYMAPEVLGGAGEPDARSDLYSLGVTLYFALAGEMPFTGGTPEGLRQAILRACPVPLARRNPAVPDDLARVCRVAMDPDPRRRHRDAAAFVIDLRRVTAGQPPLTTPPGAWLQVRRWSRNHPSKAFGIVLALLVLVVMPSLYAWQQARALAVSQRLSDLHLVKELNARAPELWPASPERLPGAEGIDAWLATTAELLLRQPRHVQDLRQLRTKGRAIPREQAIVTSRAASKLAAGLAVLHNNLEVARQQMPAGWEDWVRQLEQARAPLQRRLDEVYGYAFASDDDLISHRRLAELTLSLDELAEHQRSVQSRRSKALDLQRTTLVEATAAWTTTLAAIADTARNPQYRGLCLQPQFGLLPLGQDPHSLLFEFAHLASGAPAVRDADGTLRLADDSGIVLVLLPGGNVRIGADRDAAGPHHDPDAELLETPSIVVQLDPFFLSKYELTQGQWQAQTGSLAGIWKPGYQPRADLPAVTLRHPIQPISVKQATMVLRQLGLQLPTGAQWEYGARGNTATPRWTGREPLSMAGAENAFDATAFALLPPTQQRDWALLSMLPAEPWPLTAPVDSLRPNPFGLYHVLGNADELCRDAVRSYALPLRPGDGCSDNVDNGSRRLAAFNSHPGNIRVSKRGDVPYEEPAGGVRPMRAIDGAWSLRDGD